MPALAAESIRNGERTWQEREASQRQYFHTPEGQECAPGQRTEHAKVLRQQCAWCGWLLCPQLPSGGVTSVTEGAPSFLLPLLPRKQDFPLRPSDAPESAV